MVLPGGFQLHPGWPARRVKGQLPICNLSPGGQSTGRSQLGPPAASPEVRVGFTRFGVDFEGFLAIEPCVRASGGGSGAALSSQGFPGPWHWFGRGFWTFR